MVSGFLVPTLVFLAATVSQAVRTRQGIIRVQRDMSWRPEEQDIQDFGCVVVRRADGNGGPPYAAVSGGASVPGDCAQFEITIEADNQVRFRELSLNKMMSHPSGSHWIYFDKEAGDHSADSLFLVEEYVFWNSLLPNKMLRPSNDDNRVYAEYDSGDLNVKGAGFKMFVKF